MSSPNVSEVAPPLLGLFLQLDGSPPVSRLYEEARDLIVAAEELGYHSARVTQHHFGDRYGWLPSPLPFLAAVGQRARRIHLGTVVITVPLEQPFRLAEDATVTDLLLDGRLELGLGSGLGQEVFATLGANFETRREQTRAGLEQLQAAISDAVLDERDTHLQPPSPGLADRLWFAVMSEDGAHYAAQRKLGLLLGRVEHGAGSPVANQTRTTRLYRETSDRLGHPARIAAGRTIYPAQDRATAQCDLAEALEPLIASYIKSGLVSAGASIQEVLARLHILHGHPEEIVQQLVAEQAAIGWTELLVQVNPGNLPHCKALRALELVASKIQPQLAVASLQPASAI